MMKFITILALGLTATALPLEDNPRFFTNGHAGFQFFHSLPKKEKQKINAFVEKNNSDYDEEYADSEHTEVYVKITYEDIKRPKNRTKINIFDRLKNLNKSKKIPLINTTPKILPDIDEKENFAIEESNNRRYLNTTNEVINLNFKNHEESIDKNNLVKIKILESKSENRSYLNVLNELGIPGKNLNKKRENGQIANTTSLIKGLKDKSETKIFLVQKNRNSDVNQLEPNVSTILTKNLEENHSLLPSTSETISLSPNNPIEDNSNQTKIIEEDGLNLEDAHQNHVDNTTTKLFSIIYPQDNPKTSFDNTTLKASTKMSNEEKSDDSIDQDNIVIVDKQNKIKLNTTIDNPNESTTKITIDENTTNIDDPNLIQTTLRPKYNRVYHFDPKRLHPKDQVKKPSTELFKPRRNFKTSPRKTYQTTTKRSTMTRSFTRNPEKSVTRLKVVPTMKPRNFTKPSKVLFDRKPGDTFMHLHRRMLNVSEGATEMVVKRDQRHATRRPMFKKMHVIIYT